MFSCIPTCMLLFLKNLRKVNYFCLFITLFSILFSKIPSGLNKSSLPSIYLCNVSNASVASSFVMVDCIC